LPVFSIHTGIAGESTIKIVLLVISIVFFVGSGLTKLTPSLAYTTIFILPAKVLLGISLLAAAWTNLFQCRTIPQARYPITYTLILLS